MYARQADAGFRRLILHRYFISGSLGKGTCHIGKMRQVPLACFCFRRAFIAGAGPLERVSPVLLQS